MKFKPKKYVVRKGKNLWLPKDFPQNRNPVYNMQKAKVFSGYYEALHAMMEARDIMGTGHLHEVRALEGEAR